MAEVWRYEGYSLRQATGRPECCLEKHSRYEFSLERGLSSAGIRSYRGDPITTRRHRRSMRNFRKRPLCAFRSTGLHHLTTRSGPSRETRWSRLGCPIQQHLHRVGTDHARSASRGSLDHVGSYSRFFHCHVHDFNYFLLLVFGQAEVDWETEDCISHFFTCWKDATSVTI